MAGSKAPMTMPPPSPPWSGWPITSARLPKSSAESGTWFSQHPEVFAKTALLFNCEHTGLADTGHNSIRPNDQPAAYNWYAGHTEKLAGLVVNAMNAFGVPSGPQSAGSPPGEIGRFYQYAPSVEIINGGYVWHSDH